MKTIQEDISSASEWISSALASSGYRADFTPPSLWDIDRFFDEQSQDGAPRPGGLLAENLGQRVFAIGCYVGETLRRAKGGEWVGDDADPQVELNVELRFQDGARCWPIQRVMKRFKNGAEDGVAAYGIGMGFEVGPKPTATPKSSAALQSAMPWPFWKKLLV
jgi:hypothetical protein